jgi:hypothetical protein
MAYNDLGFGNYLRKEGLAYHLVPAKHSGYNTDKMYDNVMNRFAFGNAHLDNVYYDEENRQELNLLRRTMSELAIDLCAQGRKQDAQKVLGKADAMIPQKNMPYGMPSRGNSQDRSSLLFLEACYRAGQLNLAAKVSQAIKTDAVEEVRYYNTLAGNRAAAMQYDLESAQSTLKDLDTMAKMKWQ